MSTDLIERLAREAGLREEGYKSLAHEKALARFAALVAEECAKEFDEMADDADAEHERSTLVKYYDERAAAIRAKFPKP